MTETTPTDAALTRTRGRLAKGVILVFVVLAIIAWVSVLAASIRKTPGLEGVLSGVFLGLFAGLLVMLGGALLAARVAFQPRPARLAASANPQLGEALGTQFADVLAELETSRLSTVAKIHQRAAWRVPLCVAAGLGLWIASVARGQHGDFGALVYMVIGGGFLGYMWAANALSARYGQLYKSSVLPKLAASFGDLTYRQAILPDLKTLKAERIFREYDAASAEDEIVGAYRDLPIDILELKLTKGSGKEETIVFKGLIVDIVLSRDTGATTAIVADEGSIGNFRDRMMANGRQRVALEDPVFERIYEVYSTDQIAARTLLHPAFMERLLKLGERPGYGRPLALAQGRKLTFAMPSTMTRSLFRAPSFEKPANSRETLVSLHDDIAAVLSAADALIDLDGHFAARKS